MVYIQNILDLTNYLITNIFDVPAFEYFCYMFILMFIVWFYWKVVICL